MKIKELNDRVINFLKEKIEKGKDISKFTTLILNEEDLIYLLKEEIFWGQRQPFIFMGFKVETSQTMPKNSFLIC